MGRVTHFEIHADNPERAIRFYEGVFGWTFHRWEGPQEYWLITTGPQDAPGINGGLTPRRGPIDGDAVIAYVCNIDVDDVDNTIDAIEAGGGMVVVPKISVPGVGWLVYFKDTEGNIVGAMQRDASAG